MRVFGPMILRAFAISALVLGSIASLGGEAAAQPPWALDQNDPNPFCPATDGTTSIGFAVQEFSHVVLVVLSPDSTTVIKTLVDANLTAGFFVATWDGTDDLLIPVAPGNYPYRLTAETSGEFTILFEDTKVATIACASPVEPRSWGGIKALHAQR